MRLSLTTLAAAGGMLFLGQFAAAEQPLLEQKAGLNLAQFIRPFRQGGARVLRAAQLQAAPVAQADAADPNAEKKKEEPADEPAVVIPASKGSPDGIRLHLMDDSVISGKLTLKELDVETDFGPLKIPVERIVSFTPGLGSHPELSTKIDEYLEDLGSTDFTERENAQRELQKMGVMVRAELEKRQDDPDVERRNRIKKLLTELDELETDSGDFEEDEGKQPEGVVIRRDTIVTTDFTIVGKIVPQSFEMASNYGPLKVKLSDIRQALRDVGGRPEIRKSLVVNGSNLVQNDFKSSGVRVTKGDLIEVAADGSITMTPWGDQAVATPDGAPNYGWYIPGQIASGTLVGKIGENGQVQKIGRKASFRADRSGTLYFAIAIQNDYAQNGFPGQYNLKLRLKPKP
ncbi:MAG TPA: hypothetical protein VGE52_17960 [Pirellulales bacterium]